MTIKNLEISVNLSAESAQTIVNDIIGETTNKNTLKYMVVDALTKYMEVGGTLKSLNKLLDEFDADLKVIVEIPKVKKGQRRSKPYKEVQSSFVRYSM